MEKEHIRHQKASRILRRVYDITSNGGLPKTGQYSSWAWGDDGYYQKGYPIGGGQRFIDNGDNTVIDLATGLMWVKDLTQLGGVFASSMYWYDAINACENLDYAGWSDWRLPNINELLSIINHSMYYPCLDQNYFIQYPPDVPMWSSTRCASWYDGAWMVNFYDGAKYVYGVPWDMCYVRPVRAGQA